jgi:hypothetical protein
VVSRQAESAPARQEQQVEATGKNARRLGWLHDRRALLAVGLTLLALLPVIATVLTRAWSSYVPTGDLGMIDLRVRDVWSADIPLLGPYSRYGWSHPGPLLFWILAIPSGLFGQAPWVTLVGGAALQGVAITWLAVLAWRRGGLALVSVALVGMTLVYMSTGSWIMLEPWNPHIALPFFALFVFQSWLLATGDARVLPGTVLVATFLVQTHVGYAPLVAVVAFTVLALAVLDARARKVGSEWSTWRRPVCISLAIASVLWLPVLIEQIASSVTGSYSSYGNLAQLARSFTGGNPEPAVGVTSGLRLMAAEFHVPPSWLGGDLGGNLFTGAASEGSPFLLLLPLALLVVGMYVTRRPGAAARRRFLLLAGVLLIASIVTLTRVTGVPFPYLFLWRSTVAVLIVLGIVCAAASATRLSRWKYGAATGVVGAFVVVALGSVGLARSIVDHPKETSPFEPATKSVARQLERQRVPPGGVILRLDTTSLAQFHRGVYNELDRSGMPISVDESLDYQFGGRRGAEAEDVDEVWWGAENGRSLAYLSLLPGAEVIARSSPLKPDEEQEAEALERKILDELTAAGRGDLAHSLDSDLAGLVLGGVPGVDAGDVERLAKLDAKVAAKGSCRCGVVAMRPDVAPEDVAWLG